MTADRRAVIRWTLRLVRRGWRQQILVIALLAIAVAASIGFATAAYNMAPVSGDADFGDALAFVEITNADPATLDAAVAAAEESLGTVDVISQQMTSIPGRFEPVEYRTQDPAGAYSAPMLALPSGRYPTGADEVAVTDGIRDEFELDIGDTADLDGTARTVVGIVENPSRLDAEFLLRAPDDVSGRTAIKILTESPEAAMAFRPEGSGAVGIGERSSAPEGFVAAVGVFGVAIVTLVFAALLATAGFLVIAQSRQRQLGMLGAIGGSPHQVRLAMVTNGAAVGTIAAVIGAAVGLLGWILAAPSVSAAAGYRVDTLHIPWWVVVAGVTLGIVASTAAAWWPARMAGRASIVQALSGRPPRPVATHRSAVLAGLLIAGGLAALTFAGDIADDQSVHRMNLFLVGAGTIAAVLGLLLLCPLAIKLLAGLAAHLPFAPRLAVRDLGRYQARSGAALAAIVMALGIPIAVIIAATAAADAPANLPSNLLVVRSEGSDGPFVPAAADIEALENGVGRVAEMLDGAEVTELEVALDPGAPSEPGIPGREAVSLARRVEDGWTDVSSVYVATPGLLERFGVDLADVSSTTEFVTDQTESLGIVGVATPPEQERSDERIVERVQGALLIENSSTSLPATFVTPSALEARGWESVPSGRWLIDTDGLAEDDIAAAREIAAAGGLTIESRDTRDGLSRLQSGATAVGVLLALGVLAMTVGLMRTEAGPDVRTLTATGASSWTRRNLTACTASALAIVGALLAIVGTMSIVAAGYVDPGTLADVPPVDLFAIAVAMPAMAGMAGWLLAGREPGSIDRQAIT